MDDLNYDSKNYFYFVVIQHNNEDKFIKCGYSNNPNKRLKQLKKESKQQLNLDNLELLLIDFFPIENE